jgi:cytochrome c-type biogenesis protein CcsB
MTNQARQQSARPRISPSPAAPAVGEGRGEGRSISPAQIHRPFTPLAAMILSLSFLLPARLLAATTTDNFADFLDLSPLASLEVQHLQTLKTLDSFARQTMFQITGKSRGLDGHSALFTVLDASFRPEFYADRPIIKIRHLPLRQDFQKLSLPADQADSIVHDGLISLTLFKSLEVQNLLVDEQSNSMAKADAIGQLMAQSQTLDLLGQPALPMLRIIPPAPSATGAQPTRDWRAINDAPENPANVRSLLLNLRAAWRSGDPAATQRAIDALAVAAPTVNPAVYPSPAMRKTEVIYNRAAMLTLPGAFFYFAAFVCFLLAARTGLPALRFWALRAMILAWLIHVTGIVVRWWLISATLGSLFESIPIKNMFESVMMSAFFAVTVAMILELRRPRGIFGAAGSFVGCLSLVAIFAAPFVTGIEIGGALGQPQGVLLSYWLYIHVVMVTASYGLMGMGFLLSTWWLIRYYRDREKLGNTTGYQRSADAANNDDFLLDSGSSAVAVPSLLTNLAGVLFVSRAKPIARPRITANSNVALASARFLATLDLSNLVVLQLAFWVLGAGVICGAIWADQSWGRPWGWDPKETFALVTWIVYLIVVHVRIATQDKAWWTAVGGVVGFGVMLFNWIGVNFFLVGLHSYA